MTDADRRRFFVAMVVTLANRDDVEIAFSLVEFVRRRGPSR